MDAATERQEARPHRLRTALAVMSATVMQVIDTTIVNVALAQMQGQLSTTPDRISWVLTSDLVASGIVMLLTGYFTARVGQKRYLLLNILGFTVVPYSADSPLLWRKSSLFVCCRGGRIGAVIPIDHGADLSSAGAR